MKATSGSVFMIPNYSGDQGEGMKLSQVGEQALLERLRNWLSLKGAGVELGMGDDAAAMKLKAGRLLLLSCDSLAEGVHFRQEYTPPYSLGRKALAVAMSDIAAMGGEPRWALLSLVLPGGLELSWVEEFCRGIEREARKYKVAIVGGNVSASAAGILIDVTAAGEVEQEFMLRRAGASIGDQIWVTGTLGEAAAGLLLLEAGRMKACYQRLADRQRTPEPRFREAKLAARLGAKAAIDLSDGLAADLPRILSESGVGAEVWRAAVPISPEVKEAARFCGRNPFELALCGGEDYELLFTAPSSVEMELRRVLAEQSITASCIGRITPPEEGIILVDNNGDRIPWAQLPWEKGGYEHYKSGGG